MFRTGEHGFLQFQLQPASHWDGHTLQDADRARPFRPRLQLKSNALSHPGKGRGGDAAAYQHLFQHWANILMRQILHFTTCMLFLLLTAVIPVFAGEVIDGVVVTVNHKPIFRSDWDEAVSYELFMQRKPVAKVTEADRVTALQRLIDRQLLKAQMFDTKSLQPSEDDLQTDVSKLRAQFPE